MNYNSTFYQYLHLIKPFVESESFQPLKDFYQHGKHSVYRHVIQVSFYCYLKVIKSKKSYDLASIIRGSLLHDYFLYDWHIKHGHKGLHGYTHPGVALVNATKQFSLTKIEKDIIRNHMWPLTLFHFPKSKEAWLVCLMDKKSAIYEMHKDKQMKSN